MYDGIKLLYFSLSCPLFLQRAFEKWRHCHPETDIPERRAFSVDGFEFKYSATTGVITVNGSIHKYWTHGRNDTLFTLSQVREAILNLCRERGIDPYSTQLKHIEIGLNIEVECPDVIINAAVLFGGQVGEFKVTKKVFLKKWKFEDYWVKLYRKAKNLLRYEVHVNRMRHLPFQIGSLAELCSIDNARRSLNYLVSNLENFVFVPDKGDKHMNAKDSQKWERTMNPAKWVGLSKDQKCRRIAWIKSMIKSHDMIDWQSYLGRKIESMSSAIIDVPDDESAIISALECLSETVAGAEGSRDRQAEKELIIEPEDTVVISSCKSARLYSIDFLDIFRLMVESNTPSTRSIFKEVIYLDCSRLLERCRGVLAYDGFRVGGRGPPPR